MALPKREEPEDQEIVRPTRQFNAASHAPATIMGASFIQEGSGLDLQEVLLARTSGNRVQTFSASSGDYYEEKEDEEEQDRKRVESFRNSFGGIQFEGIHLTVNSFVDKMNASLASDRAWKNMNSHFVEVTDNEILRDKDGKVVKTLEEKRKMEDDKGVCLAGYSQDELTRDSNGKLVLGSAYLAQSSLEEQIREKEKVVADVQSGKVKLEDVPDQFKKEAADRVREDQQPKADQATTPSIASGLSSLLGNKEPQPETPAPSPMLQPKFSMAPTPPSL